VKTTQQIRRTKVRKIFRQVLEEEELKLDPVSIVCSEDSTVKKTTVGFSFLEKIKRGEKEIKYEDVRGLGFIDCVFTTCLKHYTAEYSSLGNLRFLDLLIQPIFKYSSESSRAGAKTDVVLKMDVAGQGIAEFKSRSRSLVFSSYMSILKAFEFYINCDLAFHRLKFLVRDAKERSRADLVNSYIHKLTFLTEVNRYD
jgi:hypothetical protein